MSKTQIPLRLPERTVDQLSELTDGGYSTNRTAAVVEAINLLHDWRVNGNAPTNVLMVVPSGKAQSIPICDKCKANINGLFEE